MMELLTESVRLANLPFTILLGVMIVYWLLMSLGLFSFDTGAEADVHADFHGDVHTDVHMDAHADADTDGHVETTAEPGLISGFFQFLNIGQVPMMVVFSVMILCLWMISMALNYYWSDGTALRWALFLGANLVVTCILTHFLTQPFKVLFKALNKEYGEHAPIVGRTCTVMTSEATAQFGQAQIETGGSPILINIRTSGDEVLKKGDTGLVIKEDQEKSIYSVVKVTSEKLEG
jgi:hypothetical protein